MERSPIASIFAANAISGLDLYKDLRLRLCVFVNFKTIHLRIEFYKAAFLQQGNDFDISVFVRTSKY